jgi:prepilin-type N-terminal cleavage/methylation domain-containing protein
MWLLMLYSDKRKDTGFTLIEVLTVIVVLAILSAIAIFQFSLYRANAYDTVAQSDYANLKREFSRLNVDSEEPVSFMFSSLSGPLRMPVPLSNISLSRGSRLEFAVQTVSNNGSDITQLIQIYHSAGRKVFRFVSVNGTTSEQTFALGQQPTN